ncbi:KGG domain-containing protein [Massilia sp. 9096]|uniref:KGG domain-containing protein n=1 Tax=Massilia sp. 9096 TaxID=1500894 RepID=UPI00055E9E14|nr:KGG domain-containing protein [Massilia sp. 9096]
MASNQGGNKGNNQSGDTSNRGFASMDPQKQREIASEGGKAAHASGNAHEFNSEEARRAGSMSHKNDGNNQSEGGGNQQSGNSTRGGSPEQHAKAGSQSHKNDNKR